MIERGFNFADSIFKEMTDFFETRVENLEPKEEDKIFCSYQESENKKSAKNHKWVDYNVSVI